MFYIVILQLLWDLRTEQKGECYSFTILCFCMYQLNKGSGMLHSFMSTWFKLESFVKIRRHFRKCPLPHPKTGLCASLCSFFMTDAGCERDMLTVGSAIPGLVVLSSIRKQAEQVMRSKSISSTLPWPLHRLLLPGSCLESWLDFPGW